MNSDFSTEDWGGPSQGAESPPNQDQTIPVRILADRYRIEGRLGSGAFGEVFLATDERLSRRVALKVLLFAGTGEDAAVRAQRFLGEARTLARLDHPHIVPVWDAGIEDGRPWIAMRIVEGESLRNALKARGPFPVGLVLRLLSQITSALGHAHRKGIVHRDVKPENILLEQPEGSEHAWLTDFGIAKLLDGQPPITSDRAAAGTPGYMAPEQVAGRKVDGRADLFALGCVAAELVIARRAFSGESIGHVLHAIVHETPDLAGLSDQAGSAFEAMVRRCLTKSPADRWQTADELAAELRALSDGVSQKPKKRSLGWIRRRKEPWNGVHPLMVEGLRKSYSFRKPVLSDLNLQIPRSSVYALLGRNGCGKSTLLRTCLGIYRRDKGRVELFGRDPEKEGPAVLGRVGLALDAPAVDERMKVRELLVFTSHFYPQWDQAYCYKLLARYELPLEMKIRNLSRGMKTKVSLVLALAHRPELLVLDDPALGLDAVVLDELMETLEEVSRKEGSTILVASHNYEEVERIATHVGLLRDGKIWLTEELGQLKQRVREVSVRFRDAVPDLNSVHHLRILRTEGRQLTGIVLDTRGGTLEQLKAMEPESLNLRELSLRELVVGFLR
jgi:ABC-type multidrug transport system ATPase subunit